MMVHCVEKENLRQPGLPAQFADEHKKIRQQRWRNLGSLIRQVFDESERENLPCEIDHYSRHPFTKDESYHFNYHPIKEKKYLQESVFGLDYWDIYYKMIQDTKWHFVKHCLQQAGTRLHVDLNDHVHLNEDKKTAVVTEARKKQEKNIETLIKRGWWHRW